jgi:hypothetical protein
LNVCVQAKNSSTLRPAKAQGDAATSDKATGTICSPCIVSSNLTRSLPDILKIAVANTLRQRLLPGAACRIFLFQAGLFLPKLRLV